MSIASWIGLKLGVNVQSSTLIIPSLPIFILVIILGSIGEEIGWRGFLQSTFEYKYSKLLSAIFVGIIWGLWHIGHYQKGWIFMIGFFAIYDKRINYNFNNLSKC